MYPRNELALDLGTVRAALEGATSAVDELDHEGAVSALDCVRIMAGHVLARLRLEERRPQPVLRLIEGGASNV